MYEDSDIQDQGYYTDTDDGTEDVVLCPDVCVEFRLSTDSRYKIGVAYSFHKNGLTTALT